MEESVIKSRIETLFSGENAGKKAIVRISGTDDDILIAKAAVEMLGSDRVIGVQTPHLKQEDFSGLIDELGIQCYTIPITAIVAGIHNQLEHEGIRLTFHAVIDMPDLISRVILKMTAYSFGGIVVKESFDHVVCPGEI